MIHIYFEDADIIVCEKPAGVNSQKSDDKNNMIDLFSMQGKTVLPVHRLDIGTAGIMVYAKNTGAAAKLSQQMQNLKFTKAYVCVAHNRPEQNEGVYEDLLFRDKQKNKSFVVKRERRGVKKAVLSYKILDIIEKDGEPFSVWHIHLQTGRTHQIRVQLSSRKMPLVGDKKYGANDNYDRILLKSIYLSFFHPKTGEPMAFGEKEPIPSRLFPDIYTFEHP